MVPYVDDVPQTAHGQSFGKRYVCRRLMHRCGTTRRMGCVALRSCDWYRRHTKSCGRCCRRFRGGCCDGFAPTLKRPTPSGKVQKISRRCIFLLVLALPMLVIALLLGEGSVFAQVALVRPPAFLYSRLNGQHGVCIARWSIAQADHLGELQSGVWDG